MIKVNKSRKSRICQGDIFRDIEYIEYVSEKKGIIEVSKIIFPLVIVLTQDCDLQQDYKFRWSREGKSKTQDKWLVSVLVAPLYNAEHVFQGSHLSDLDLEMEPIKKNRSPGTFLKENQNPRYHYLDFPPNIPLVPSIIDFKHYFSVNVQYLKKIKTTNYICSISNLFREDISQRFAGFLARIGLPEIKEVKKVQ
jgi:hypothetical protein